MTRILTLYETYSRQDVHDIFDPSTRFTPSAGTWGLWGIVPVSGKVGDFVLFVTFGREQAGHQFDEWITEDGVINWQSQPRQSLTDRQIQQFIHHTPAVNTIHLFLRTEKKGLYTYLGRLAYHSHDPQRERPVWIQWQILDWPIPQKILEEMRLQLKPVEVVTKKPSSSPIGFEWRGVRYDLHPEKLREEIHEALRLGLPEEATRFRDWFVEVEGQRVSAKWVFHLITGAEYSEFDAPTARNKLSQIGLQSKPVDSEPVAVQMPLVVDGEKHQIKEQSMYKAKYYKTSTVNAFIDLLKDLTLLGEVQFEQKDAYYLTDYHFIDLMRSTFVLANPHALVASPKLINLLPLENINYLLRQLSLSSYYGDGWPNFPEKAFKLSIEERYPQLNQQYILIPKPDIIFEDKIPRPVFLFNYFNNHNDWEDWTIDSLFKLHRVYTEPKLFVHSTLPIQNLFGGLSEVQLAVWKSAFYWVMIQLLVLSDTQTGAMYDPKISLFLSNGWQDNSQARLYLQDEYLGELVDCLEPILACFGWVWVNRNGDPIQDQQAILGLLRFFLKLEITELSKDGRVQFTEEYRRQLFESQTKARLQYMNSKDARDQLRDAIKELKK